MGTVIAPQISRGTGSGLWKSPSRQSETREREEHAQSYNAQTYGARHHGADNISEKEDPHIAPWAMMDDLKTTAGRFEATDASMERRLGVTFKDLTVRAPQSGVVYNETVLSQFKPGFLNKRKEKNASSKEGRAILDSVSGCARPGEMLLVLGRPDAGCTTLLKMLSNRRNGYGTVEGDVHFGNMTAQEAKDHRELLIMNTEDEVFFPTLTVGQTLDFATRMKLSYKNPEGCTKPDESASLVKDFLLKAMNITHTSDTKVGNEYVRGVSGGERKRVSILECMAARGSVYAWDNSTRGLDASTALDWAKALRAMTDVLGLTTIVTLYQAGNGIYKQFDKVLVLEEGQELFYGPREDAVPFMESLGFFCDPSANKADFLTSVCVPTERKIRPGYEGHFPRTASEIRAAWQVTQFFARMQQELSYPSKRDSQQHTQNTLAIRGRERHKSLPKGSSLTTSWLWQVKTCIIRQYQIIWGDKVTLVVKQVAALIQALVAGSLFYNAPDNSAGLFVKGGALFFAILYNSLTSMSEVTESFLGRPVMAKHRSFAFYHPSAFCIAQIASDIPILLFGITHFGIVLYFMAGLTATAEAFFTFWIVLFAISMCITALFRTIGAAFGNFDDASKVSGLAVSALIMYTGYMISKPKMHPWFVWIYWIDPMAYAFEALLGNEFHGKTIQCVGNNIIPSGAMYTDPTLAACSGIGGAPVGATSLSGDEYLASLSYSHSHLWRNFGITWVWWAFFVGLTVFFTCRWEEVGSGGRKLLVPREKEHLARAAVVDKTVDIEKGSHEGKESSSGIGNDDALQGQLVRNTSVFTWKNLTYTVKTPSGDRVLLDNVQGFVRPGMLGALMGSSGAGKTTLLDVLAQRKTDGTICGSIMVDGRPLSIAFQRSAGYCEQLDIHEPFATVREALEFSALLRQSRETSREDRLRYVDTIIDLLELHDLEHTLIGRVGAGLNVEQRKRVTIGVELVSKPSILIFLDEPTSGLDGQASYNTVRFLRKLADVGQSVLVTIHQPSAQLFSQFDTLLLLARGGKTVYFGDIGEDATTIKEYFGKNGAPCPKECNPAEHMIDVVSGTLSQGKDWNQVWLRSPEYAQVTKTLDNLIADAANRPPGYVDDGHEFAASYWEQTKIVTQRMNAALFRNTGYINNKIALHISSALFNAFSFWMIGSSVADLQLKLFTIFNFIFVAPGVIAQLQPLFLERRDLYEAREKKSKMYHWAPFVTGLIVSELPYLVLCAILYFVCWYYTVGFPNDAWAAGSTLFVMIMYEFVYTGIGQFIAAYAPSAVAASLVNPLLLGVLISFCGVLVPYGSIQPFWRYWIYYLNPFTFLMGSLLSFGLYSAEVTCSQEELAVFDPPSDQSCQQYLAEYLTTTNPGANLLNPEARSGCEVCAYSIGPDYLSTINIGRRLDGWRDAAIVVIFAVSSYVLVYVLMKLRTKKSKTAS